MRTFQVLFLLSLFVGCRQNTIPGLVPVAGTVSIDQKPLQGAMVVFIPVDDTSGVGGSGRTQADGSYQLKYLRGGAGVFPGKYKVVVSKRVMPDGSPLPDDDETPPHESPARESLPPHFSGREQTRLTAVVPETGGQIHLELK